MGLPSSPIGRFTLLYCSACVFSTVFTEVMEAHKATAEHKAETWRWLTGRRDAT